MNRTGVFLVSALGVAALLSGCGPVLVAGGGVALADVAGERRGPMDFFDDNYLAWRVRSDFIQSELVSAGRINVSVYKRHVTLTGGAVSQQEIDEAIRLTRNVPGVQKVSSEIKVQGVSATDLVTDSLISSQVKVKFLGDDVVRGLDFHVETTKGVVYLTGLAKNVSERDRAVNLAQSIPGVREVVSFVEVEGFANQGSHGKAP